MSGAEDLRLVRETAVALAIGRAERAAEACREPACVDARAQARRVPRLLKEIVRLRSQFTATLGILASISDDDVQTIMRGRGKIRALEAALASLRAEHRQEVSALQEKARDLQDALVHAQHEKAGADGRAALAGEREKALQARNGRLENQLRVDHAEFLRVCQLSLDLKHDLQLLLDAEVPAPAINLPAQRFGNLGYRRQWEIGQAMWRALGSLNRRGKRARNHRQR